MMMANRGARWCVDQDTWLWDNILTHSKEKLASIMQRTPYAIQSRLATLACQKITQNVISLDEAISHAKVSVGEIDKKMGDIVYYAVYNGREGDAVYTTWHACKANVTGKNARYKKVKTPQEASEFIAHAKKDDDCDSDLGLNEEQRLAFDAVKRGESILLCGSAGTGKSFTLKHVVEWAARTGRQAQQTAMTGAAALLVNGRTLHSYLGIGLAKSPVEELVEKTIESNKPVARQLRRLNILLIDEVSMLDAGLCDKIDEYLRIIRGQQTPFGGIQIVFSGDFYQIRPVKGDYAFKSKSWKALAPKKHMLKRLIRQADDVEFQNMLERLKDGVCCKEDLKRLSECRTKEFAENLKPTRMYSLNKDVDNINNAALANLIKETGGEARRYLPDFDANSKENRPKAMRWAQSCGFTDGIHLCIGAQVVVTRNMEGDSKLVNGSRGVVVKMQEHSVIIRLRNGRDVIVPYVHVCDTPSESNSDCNGQNGIYVSVMPLKLAWVISVHKSQGMTLDAIEVDLGSTVFEYGQAYTALSRARSLDSVKIVNICPKAFKCHPDVYEFMEPLAEK